MKCLSYILTGLVLLSTALVPFAACADSAQGARDCVVPLNIPATADQFKPANNKEFAKSITAIANLQHANDNIAKKFYADHGYNFNDVNIVILNDQIKNKYQKFYDEYMRQEKNIGLDLLTALQKFGVPSASELGNSQMQALWLTTRVTDGDIINEMLHIISMQCVQAHHPIQCVVIPFLTDRAQFLQNKTQTFGTLPDVPLQPRSSIKRLNMQRAKYALSQISDACYSLIDAHHTSRKPRT